MTQFEEVTKGESKEMPARLVIYGVPKVGKTRFASQAPDAFFINVEEGLDYLPTKVRSTPKLSNIDDVFSWLKHIHDSDTFKAGTIVIDSIDWCERLAQDKLVNLFQASSITDNKVKEFAYHNGVTMAADDARKVIGWLNAIYKKKGIKAIIIAHAQIRLLDLPNKEPYKQHEMKVSKGLGAYICEWADLVLFADYSFVVSKDGNTSAPKPVLMAGGSAAYVGGGRMKLDKELPIDYAALEKYIGGVK